MTGIRFDRPFSAPALFLNPRLPEDELQFWNGMQDKLAAFPDHLWILSSGSTRSNDETAKLIGLSRPAFLAAAAGANEHLQVQAGDRWGLLLPEFHVGGLSILARSFLSRSDIVDLRKILEAGSFRTQAATLVGEIDRHQVSLVSMVPTQVFDFVSLGLKAPSCLRAVVVGGAALAPDLYLAARHLGWPVLPSFGMTEVGSQVATATLDSLRGNQIPPLRILPHIQTEIESGTGFLRIRSAGLLTGYFQGRGGQVLFTDPKQQGWLTTADRCELSDGNLRPLGRSADFVKINGEGVDLFKVRSQFSKRVPAEWQNDFAVVDLPDPRQGTRLILAVNRQIHNLSALQEILHEWNRKAFPPERLQEVVVVESLPRTELGKIAWADLRERIRQELGKSLSIKVSQ